MSAGPILAVDLLAELGGNGLAGRGAASSSGGVRAVELNRMNAMLRNANMPPYEDQSVLSELPCFRSPTRTFPSSWLAHLQRLYAHVLIGTLQHWKPATSPLYEFDSESDDDDVLDVALETEAGLRSHLLCHSIEGYWLPLAETSQSGSVTGCDFKKPLWDDTGRLPGGWFGSSYSLLSELLEMCPTLGIELRPLRGAGALKALRRGGGMDLSAEALEALRASSEEALLALKQCIPDLEIGDSSAVNCDGLLNRRGDFTLAPLSMERHVWFVLYEAVRLSTKHRTAILLSET